MKYLYQIRVEKISWNIKGSWELMCDLYAKVLFRDYYWHFFWEGDHTLLRVEFLSLIPVIKFLRGRKVKFSPDNIKELNLKNYYVDPNKIVAKYQELYQPVFHSFSVLAIKLFNDVKVAPKTDELWEALDRIVHPFLLMNANWQRCVELAKFIKIDTFQSHIYWEPMMICFNAICRAIYTGRMWERINMREESKNDMPKVPQRIQPGRSTERKRPKHL